MDRCRRGGMTPNLSSKPRRRLVPLTVALAAATVLGTACGGGSGDKAAAGVTASTTAPAGAVAMAIDIKGFAFQPNPVHVAIGTTVTWTNQDEILHTVTSG